MHKQIDPLQERIIESFTLPGWTPSHFGVWLESVIDNYDDFADIQPRLVPDKNKEFPADQITYFIDFAESWNEKKHLDANQNVVNFLFPDPGIGIDCFQFGPNLDIKAYCFYEYARPFFQELIEAIKGMARRPVSLPADLGNLQFEKAGRKSDKIYDQAFDKIIRGDDYKDVFLWYCEKAGIKDPAQYDRDNFRKAMKRREEKLKRT